MQPVILSSGLAGRIMYDIRKRYSAQGVKICSGLPRDQIAARMHQTDKRLAIIYANSTSSEDGLDTVRRIRAMTSSLPILYITRHSSEARAVAALRAGVNDYFKTPVSMPLLFKSIDGFLDHQTPAGVSLPGRMKPEMIGSCACMRSIKKYLVRVAGAASTVLITGETGTGKELAADFIHAHSRRAHRPMVTVNCAALPESLTESELFGYERGAFTGAVARQPGKFVQADGGTIFLDEIGDMSPLIQAKILHAIERKMVYPLGADAPLPIDTRIIAATNRELEALMASGRFREDLYYRLNIARVYLPPLRERRQDIPDLVACGIQRMNKAFQREVKGMTARAMDMLINYPWPGNVRELMNLLEGVFINLPHDRIDYADLPGHFKQGLQNSMGRSKNERRRIVDTLMKTNWNKSHAAEQLKWSRMTLYRKMAMYKIVENRGASAVDSS